MQKNYNPYDNVLEVMDNAASCSVSRRTST